MRKFFFIISTIITTMIGHKTIANEQLVTEDGNVNAQNLPHDKETSKLSYETATFGIG